MLDNVKQIQEKVGTLVNWVSDMKTLVSNPYANGLNMQRVLEDLGGFAADLTRDVYNLEKELEEKEEPVEVLEAEETEKAESASE